MTCEALIQAAGVGARLKLGPKAFLELGGVTLLQRAIDAVMPAVDHVLVAVSPGEMDRAVQLAGRERVRIIEGGTSRSETTRRLVEQATAPLLLLHDVVHPFVTPGLVSALLSAAARHGAAAPAVPNADFLYAADGRVLHAPGAVLVGQKPVAFSRQSALLGYQRHDPSRGEQDPSLLQVLELAGVRTHFIPGDTANIKITYPGDLVLARAIIAMGEA